jgi:signal transduction histidine kinase
MADSRHLRHIELILHELRTPVNVAAGSVAQLLEPDTDPITAAQQAVLQRAARACSQLEQLCEDLRDWAQLSGSEEPLVAPAPLGPALQEAARAAESTRRDAVHVQLPDDLAESWRVMTPPGLLVRTLTAVIAACVRTAPARTSMPVVVEDDPGRGEIRVLVGAITAPPGDGFEAERMGGLGFVLPLARAVVDAVGGRIWSASGSGRVVGIGLSLPTPPQFV